MSEISNELIKQLIKLNKSRYFVILSRMGYMHHGHNAMDGRGKSRMLKLISQKDGLTNSQITELLDIRPSSVSLQVKSLEEAGLVIRKNSEEDKRVSMIYITEKGQEVIKKRNSELDEWSQKLFENLDENEMVQLEEILKKVNSQLTKLDKSSEEIFKEMFGEEFSNNPHFHHHKHSFDRGDFHRGNRFPF